MSLTSVCRATHFVIFCFVIFATQTGFACTCFLSMASGRPVLACNFDWIKENGDIYFNNRGTGNAEFSSLTFNQHGPNQPLAGMNETGLSVHVLRLDTTEYPTYDSPIKTNPLQFVQYMLDNFQSLDEIQHKILNREVNIVSGGGFGGLHYIVCAAGGKCMVIESSRHEFKFHKFAEFPVVTNLPYEETQSRVREGNFIQPTSRVRSDRRAETVIQGQSLGLTPFQILDSVKVKSGEYLEALDNSAHTSKTAQRLSEKYKTNWQIVFDLNNKRVHWKSHTVSSVQTMDLKHLTKSHHAGVVMNLQSRASACSHGASLPGQ